jgi:hypothetical protein
MNDKLGLRKRKKERKEKISDKTRIENVSTG